MRAQEKKANKNHHHHKARGKQVEKKKRKCAHNKARNAPCFLASVCVSPSTSSAANATPLYCHFILPLWRLIALVPRTCVPKAP